MSQINLANTQFAQFVKFANSIPNAAKSKVIVAAAPGNADGENPLADRTVFSSKQITMNPGSTIGTGVSLTIKADEFERMAKLDYSKFDDTEARKIIDDKNLVGALNHAVDSLDESFRFRNGSVEAFMKFSAKFV